MRKTNPMIVTITGALIFACALSCDEEQESVLRTEQTEIKNEEKIRSKSNRSSGITKFDGTEGDPIDLVTAKKWASNFRETMTSSDEIQAHYFGFEIIKQILEQPGCVGIRMYYALDEKGEKKLLLVGVDAQGENMTPTETEMLTDGGNIIADFSFPCPTTCPGTGL